ncbi:DUF4025 domain-containing protein [Ectobacillus antri]|jgi:hypothetical protein|uniref:DUF4025 domain-containing protein n=1 Tax=Ectobacillus antri TaxID=2486280 RepID=A0ABT6H4D9_9BACI|nr:DUF4025 domain-containing protein [Ectobacillus antri]MDG4656872.1 DUF4025 domain-containing protein [Ectobacillus antri]MDG5754231.1 DUF4025 domain-containing protein [Ectobacillus antri]
MMSKEQYKDTGKLTNKHYGEAREQSNQSLTQEQVQNTLTEGTIDQQVKRH